MTNDTKEQNQTKTNTIKQESEQLDTKEQNKTKTNTIKQETSTTNTIKQETSTLDNQNTKENQDKKQASFWVGLTCGVIVLIQFVCFYFLNTNLKVELIVEGVSLVLALLVFMGVLKTQNTGEKKDLFEIKEDLQQEMQETINKNSKITSNKSKVETSKTTLNKTTPNKK